MIRYELRGDTAWVTLDRPEKMNALDLAGWDDLRGALDRAGGEARAAVLRGAGDAFCAGDDVATLADLDGSDDAEALADRLYDGLFGVETLPIPVVAAVDGLAYGGGLELVAAADLAVATDGATFALPETRVGAYPPYFAARVAETAGRKRVMELALTGEPVDAPTAREWGLVNRVVAPDDLEGAVAGLVEAATAAPPRAVALLKRHVRAGTAGAGERERLHGGFAAVAGDPDCRAAARAFLADDPGNG